MWDGNSSLSRRQQGFKSPWGRHPKNQARQSTVPFLLSIQDIPLFKRDSSGELVLSEVEGNPLGDATDKIKDLDNFLSPSFLPKYGLPHQYPHH